MPAPVGKSGVVGKGLMGMSVKADTKFPNASMALAQFFTNPRAWSSSPSRSAVYPVVAVGVRRPVLSPTPRRRSRTAPRPLAKDIVATYADIVPTVPNKADVNEIVLKAVESALFGGVPPSRP